MVSCVKCCSVEGGWCCFDDRGGGKVFVVVDEVGWCFQIYSPTRQIRMHD